MAEVPNLRVSRIDPAAETAAYRERILERSRPTLDAEGLALLEEDLRSPCTEEVEDFAEITSFGIIATPRTAGVIGASVGGGIRWGGRVAQVAMALLGVAVIGVSVDMNINAP